MGWGHTCLVPAQGVPAFQDHLHLSRHQSPQPHSHQHSCHSPHLQPKAKTAIGAQPLRATPTPGRPSAEPTCLYRKDWLSNSRFQNRNLEILALAMSGPGQPPSPHCGPGQGGGQGKGSGGYWFPLSSTPGLPLTILPSSEAGGRDTVSGRGSRAFWGPWQWEQALRWRCR